MHVDVFGLQIQWIVSTCEILVDRNQSVNQASKLMNKHAQDRKQRATT